MKQSLLNIFEYSSYREFIRDRLEELQAANNGFSKRWFVRRKLGIKSGTTYIMDIIEGKRGVSRNISRLLPESLGLNRMESSFFQDLVRYGDAKTKKEQNLAFQELKKRSAFISTHQLAVQQFDYFANPASLAIRELVSTKDFKENSIWIASRLRISISARAIKQCISDLLEFGLLIRKKNGILAPSEPHIKTGNLHFYSEGMRTYHRNMLQQAIDSIELPLAHRYLRGMTISCTDESYLEICDEIEGFINRIRVIVDQEKDMPKHVYHFASGLYPLTKRKDISTKNKD